MPRYLGKIDVAVIEKLALELLISVAWVHEAARQKSRNYSEVVFVAYGEGILVTRRMLEFSTDGQLDFSDPEMYGLVHRNWDEISSNCRTVYIARGTVGALLQNMGNSAGQMKSWWRNLGARLTKLMSR